MVAVCVRVDPDDSVGPDSTQPSLVWIAVGPSSVRQMLPVTRSQ